MSEAQATPDLDPAGEVPAMKETKGVADKRLKFEGRWTKFQVRLAAWRKKLKALRGGSKSSVNDDAWAFALAEFPPVWVPVAVVELKAGQIVTGTQELRLSKKSEVSHAKVPAGGEPGVLAVVPADGRPGAGESGIPGVDAGSEIPVVCEQAVQGLPVSGDLAANVPESVDLPFNADVKVRINPPPVASEPAAAPTVLAEPSDEEVEPYTGEPGGSTTPGDLLRDIRWVYDNLSNHALRSKDAPSGGAYGLLVWARKYRHEFFKNHLPRALAAADKDDDEKAAEKGDARQVSAIDGMLERIASEVEAKGIFYCVACGDRLRRHVAA